MEQTAPGVLVIGWKLALALVAGIPTLDELFDYARQLASLRVQVDIDQIAERAFNQVLLLAERYQLTTYDAAYLELAQRRGLPLCLRGQEPCSGGRQNRPRCDAPVKGVVPGAGKFSGKLSVAATRALRYAGCATCSICGICCVYSCRGNPMPPQEHMQAPVALSENDQRQVLELYRKIQCSRAKLVGPDGRTQSLPASLYEFLVKLIADLCEGQSVAIVQNDAQLTTVEAARMLGVSRQFLIGQLEKGEIPFHMVGTHRRVYVRDVLAYKIERDGKRRRILDDLTRAEAEEGLYDREPADDRAG